MIEENFYMSAFSDLLGSLLYWMYGLVGDYGIAMIIFTILVKFLLMPLSVKQVRSTMKMQELQPELKALQDRYKDDREKLNEEMVKFFKEKNHNPANGCLGMVVQIPIILVIFNVFRQPITYMLKGGAYITSLMEQVSEFTGNLVRTEAEIIFNYTKNIGEQLVKQEFLPLDLSQSILNIQEGMKFLGVFDLAKTPTYKLNLIQSDPWVYVPLLFLIAVLIAVTFVQTFMMAGTKKTKNANDDKSAALAGANKTMLYMSPVLIAVFSFQLPAGLTLYWLVGTVFQIFQQIYIEKTKDVKTKDVKTNTDKEKELQDRIQSQNDGREADPDGKEKNGTKVRSGKKKKKKG
jgi:YidC/Oxa1 family membrane protein insertase